MADPTAGTPRETDRSEAVAALENDIRELRGANPGELARRLMDRGWVRPEREEAGLRAGPLDFPKWRDRAIEAVETLAEDNGYALSDRDQEMVAAAVASLLEDDEFRAALRGTGAEGLPPWSNTAGPAMPYVAAPSPQETPAGPLEACLERERDLRQALLEGSYFHVTHDGTPRHPETCSECRRLAEGESSKETPDA